MMYTQPVCKIIDLGTLRCPHLLITTIHAMRQLSDGQVLQIYACDLNAPSSISSWAQQSGNKLLEMYYDDVNEHFVFFLQRGSSDLYYRLPTADFQKNKGMI